MQKEEFDLLLRQLGGGSRCMLVLGPEFINIDSNEVDFTESIQDYLARTEFGENVRHYFREDGFLFFDERQGGRKFDLLDRLMRFYNNREVTESYDLLARIPFTSIISLSPDALMVQAYKKINKQHKFC